MSLPPSEIPSGAMRFNSDSQKLEYWNGSAWFQVHTATPNLASAGDSTPGARGLFGGGNAPLQNRTIDYINIASTGDATDFGDLLFDSWINGSCSSATRGLWTGNRPSTNTINFVTIASTGNAVDFGDTTDPREATEGMGSATRGIFSGGGDHPSPGSFETVMDYVTIAQTGNSVDFGDLTQARMFPGAFSSPTRGCIAGGYIAPGAGMLLEEFLT
jgi:hypothetical protein